MIRHVFSSFDTDAGGSVCGAELAEALRTRGGLFGTHFTAMQMQLLLVSLHDGDASGGLSLPEFTALVQDVTPA